MAYAGNRLALFGYAGINVPVFFWAAFSWFLEPSGAAGAVFWTATFVKRRFRLQARRQQIFQNVSKPFNDFQRLSESFRNYQLKNLSDLISTYQILSWWEGMAYAGHETSLDFLARLHLTCGMSCSLCSSAVLKWRRSWWGRVSFDRGSRPVLQGHAGTVNPAWRS